MNPILRNALGGIVIAAVILGSGWLSPTAAAGQVISADDQFLDRLVGTWDMDGSTREQPVHYAAVGERTLARGWIEFRMRDKHAQSTYEARVFISHDVKKHDFIAHWLDQFGAPGARVVATGTRTGNVLYLTFPYAEGTFRNTWTFMPDKNEWTLLIEAQENDAWKEFAHYQLHRARRSAK